MPGEFTLSSPGGSAVAQEVPTAADTGISQVSITGIRASLRNALDTKEASNNFIEVIAAEDIGKLPTRRSPNRWHACRA